MTQINSFGFNTDKIEEDPAPAPVVKNVVSPVNEKIDNIIKNGGSVEIGGVGKKEYMAAVHAYSTERNNGTLRIELNDGVIKATNLKSSNDTEL
jgi:hypothetical protein